MSLIRLVPVFVVAAWVAACGSASPTAGNQGDAGTADPWVLAPGSGNDGGALSCTPKTCAELNANCGFATDGCGGVIDCASCASGSLCGIQKPNVCTVLADLCKPVSKEEACAGKQCGGEGDGCGKTYDCGTCPSGQGCGYVEGFQCAPTPVGSPTECAAKITSCAEAGAQCGLIGNGCGGTIDCDAELGGCADGKYCGLGGAQQCGDPTAGCTPLEPAVACAGKCGLVSNGCGAEIAGGVIDCSSLSPCPDGQACGASGVPNQCGSATGTCKPLTKTQACGSRTCGKASDGCEGFYDCGSLSGKCAAGAICKSGACEAVCQATPKATACAGKSCGKVGDGCGGTYDCGTCDAGKSCGVKTAFQCDVPPATQCVPKTQQVACAGKQCGVVYDGCGTAPANIINCGTCSGNTYCGIKTPFQCDAAPTQACTPGGSCKAMGWACGIAVDTCGNTYDCASEGRSCSAKETCFGGIDGPTECKAGGLDCPLCSAIPDCSNKPQVTQLQGRVITPGRTDSNTLNQVGVPNAFVYILRTNDLKDLPAITAGFPANGTGCDRCVEQDLGPVLASAITDAKGDYTITSGNIPVGQEFLLVVKVGKFRRAERYTVPADNACKTTTLTTTLPGNPTRLPRHMTDGLAVNIPHVAVSTGTIDAMECVFEKIGIDHKEFTRPQLAGRIHLYRANGAWPDQQSSDCNACGSSSDTNSTQRTCRTTSCGGPTISDRTNFLNAVKDSALYASVGSMSAYDMVVFDCEGQTWDGSASNNFAKRNAGGSNVREYVNRGGRMFASHLSFSWLYQNGTTAYDAATPFATGLGPAASWDTTLYTDDTGTGKVSFGRPRASLRIQAFADWLVNEAVTTSPAYSFTISQPRSTVTNLGDYSEEFLYRTDGSQQYQRVQQFSFNTPYSAPTASACGRVAYSGFHVASTGSTLSLGSSIFPSYCTGTNANNGNLSPQEKVLLYSLFDLGGCVGGEPTAPSCEPKKCAAGVCGKKPDGCGKTLDCGCSAGVCIDGQCGTPGCVPTTCTAEGATCGVISNGCGGSLDCGPCPSCTPKSEAEACNNLCGFASDGCGGVYECSLGCGASQVCSAGACTGGSCAPLTKCPDDLNCGNISDNCDGTIHCGDCALPAVCGGGGVPNVCGVPECKPLKCSDVGANCGLIGDGCGGTVDCGTCDPGQGCGIGGKPNQCAGCVPRKCGDVGATCGKIGDGCGGTVDCGTCTGGKICGSENPNQCGSGPSCTPLTCGKVGAECGKIGDGCGGTVDCGTCTDGKVCGIKTPFKCDPPPACNPATCASVGAQCGLIGDGCGGSVDCGACPQRSACGLAQPNKCSKDNLR